MMREVTGRHVLIILLSMFGVIFAVNGLFAYFAVAGFPGLVTEEPYRKGLAFNQQIARSRALREVGWKLLVGAPQDGELTVRFVDREGSPLQVSNVAVLLRHPAQADADKVLDPRPLQPGTYRMSLAGWSRGIRELRVTATGPGGGSLEFRRKLRIE